MKMKQKAQRCPSVYTSRPTTDLLRMPTRVFISCSPNDEALRAELEMHLTPSEREGLLEQWHDGKVAGGEDRRVAVFARLAWAEVILLLLSPDFLASEEHHHIEARAL